MADTLDITGQLQILGLSDQEAQLYLTLLPQGTTPILRLTQDLNLPRTTVYRLCQNLVDRGFLAWVVTRQGKKIQAVPPEKLTQIVKRQQAKLEATQSALKSLTAYQHSLHAQLPQTQVRYYHGKAGMKQVIWNTLQAKRGIIGYSGFARNEIVGQAFETDYAAERNPKKITDIVIINQVSPGLQLCLDQYPETVKFTRLYLLNQPDFQITGDTYIYNDIYAVNFWNESEIVGVEIQNSELVALQTAIFSQLLKLAKPLAPGQKTPAKQKRL